MWKNSCTLHIVYIEVALINVHVETSVKHLFLKGTVC